MYCNWLYFIIIGTGFHGDLVSTDEIIDAGPLIYWTTLSVGKTHNSEFHGNSGFLHVP